MTTKQPKPASVPAVTAGVATGAAAGAIAAVAVGAAAVAVGSRCLQIVRTKAGFARVKTVRNAAGDKIRVLQQGGVYQSATYLDERRFEPVFAYYRAFDAMFEAEEGQLSHAGTSDAGTARGACLAGMDSAAERNHAEAPSEPMTRGLGEPAGSRSGFKARSDEPASSRPNVRSDEPPVARPGEPADSRPGATPVNHVLMLGGGGYAYPKHALTQRPELAMDVVELDPAVTRLAHRWFSLDELEQIAGDRLRLIEGDARAYLSQAIAEGTRYDAIVNDCFTGAEPARSLATVEALCQVKVCLNPGGLYLANIVSSEDGENVDFLRDAAATAAAVFEHIHVVPCEDADFGVEDNYLLIATDAERTFEGEMPIAPEILGAVLRDCDLR